MRSKSSTQISRSRTLILIGIVVIAAERANEAAAEITQAGLEQLLHPRIEEVSVAVLCHPAGPRQVAVVDNFGAIRFSRRVQSEDD